jgi:hypothetical protein
MLHCFICEVWLESAVYHTASKIAKFCILNRWRSSFLIFLYYTFICVYYFYQIVAREKTGNAASAPLSISVSLNDVNDNAPKLPMIPPLTVQAGETKQPVIKVSSYKKHLN